MLVLAHCLLTFSTFQAILQVETKTPRNWGDAERFQSTAITAPWLPEYSILAVDLQYQPAGASSFQMPPAGLSLSVQKVYGKQPQLDRQLHLGHTKPIRMPCATRTGRTPVSNTTECWSASCWRCCTISWSGSRYMATIPRSSTGFRSATSWNTPVSSVWSAYLSAKQSTWLVAGTRRAYAAHTRRCSAKPLPHRRLARAGRHGRRLPRLGPTALHVCRAQGAHPPTRVGSRNAGAAAAAVRARSLDTSTPEPSQPGAGDRLLRRKRQRLSGDGFAAGGEPGGSDIARRPPAGSAGAGVGFAAPRCAGILSWARYCPPGHQTAEHSPAPRWARGTGGFRAGQTVEPQ
ncbi:MAG: hypothetical protein BWY63_02898 [Chloroflexi bacterium ADurb.Bin360]|nr:MAG: hypothetical protein BWY63_02898 [Chloroflexi bacterium ADurb.Bin360]